MITVANALARCRFEGSDLALAVSGGADSVGLALLVHAAGVRATLHHVDHHLRGDSSRDAELVARLANDLGFSFVLHDVTVAPGGNLESRARAARRNVLPEGVLTGHTMDDLAETVLINLMRGAGIDGLAPMVNDPSKPLLALRRSEVLSIVTASRRDYIVDSTNSDTTLLRNRVRLETLPMLCEVAQRDLVPVLARQAQLMGEERRWLELVSQPDLAVALEDADCRELATWPVPRLRRWLRVTLSAPDAGDGVHPPSAAEIDRVIDVVRGETVATQIAGARRVSRHGQRLRISGS